MSAVLGIEKLLRPAWNFEFDYDGQSGGIPIFFTWPAAKQRPALGVADYSVLDERARLTTPAPGVSPLLAKFVVAPAGSSMLVMFPVVPSVRLSQSIRRAYVWRVVWRTRSTADYVQDATKRKPYQIGKTTFGAFDSRTEGVPDSRGISNISGDRVVIPGAGEGAIYGHGEPNPFEVGDSPMYGTLMPDAVAIPVDVKLTTKSPFYPGQANYVGDFATTMDYQQGVFDPDFPGVGRTLEDLATFNPVTATHLSKWIKCQGTEFAVECYKFEYTDPKNIQTYTPRAWQFLMGDIEPNLPNPGSEDYAFSVMFGIGALASPANRTPPVDTGVRVMVGTAPY